MAKFPARLPRSRLEKPRSREPSQPALSYEDVEIFLKGSRDVPRSRKPGQLGQPGSYEEALNLSFNYSCGLLRLRVKSDWSQNTINIPEVILRHSWFYRFHCNKVQAFLSFTHDLVQASLRNLTTKAVSQTNNVCVC